MKDDLRYTPSDCFETFPFPEGWSPSRQPEESADEQSLQANLDAAGRAYYDFRATLMVENDEGITQTYNRFHDPDDRSPGIVRLRELHAGMDHAVLTAYGWDDVPIDCEFLLDHEIDEEEWSPRRRKPWRYRWPDDVRDEVLARLLELNAKRAYAEARAGGRDARKRSTDEDPANRTDLLF